MTSSSKLCLHNFYLAWVGRESQDFGSNKWELMQNLLAGRWPHRAPWFDWKFRDLSPHQALSRRVAHWGISLRPDGLGLPIVGMYPKHTQPANLAAEFRGYGGERGRKCSIATEALFLPWRCLLLHCPLWHRFLLRENINSWRIKQREFCMYQIATFGKPPRDHWCFLFGESLQSQFGNFYEEKLLSQGATLDKCHRLSRTWKSHLRHSCHLAFWFLNISMPSLWGFFCPLAFDFWACLCHFLCF